MPTVTIVSGTPRPPDGGRPSAWHWYDVWRRMAEDPGEYRTGSLRVLRPDQKADFTVVVNHPGSPLGADSWTHALDRTVLIQLEPYAVHRGKWGAWTDPAFHGRLRFAHTIATRHMGIDWAVGYNRPDLYEHRPEKTRACSAVLSWKTHHPGHKLRMRLVREHLTRAPWFDLYGTICRDGEPPHPRWLGALPTRQKQDALDPYMYHLCVENSQQSNYWTEKLTDALLCECLPLYWGCPNLPDFLPEDCVIPLPLDNPGHAAAMMEEISSSPIYWHARIGAVREARRLILDRYNVWSVLARELGDG